MSSSDSRKISFAVYLHYFLIYRILISFLVKGCSRVRKWHHQANQVQLIDFSVPDLHDQRVSIPSVISFCTEEMDFTVNPNNILRRFVRYTLVENHYYSFINAIVGTQTGHHLGPFTEKQV